MKISHALGIAAIAVLAAVAPASADSGPSPSDFTLKVGGSLQSGGGETSGFAAGMDYVLHPSSTLQPLTLSAYADLLGRAVGAGLAVRNGGPMYVGAGLGLYSVNAQGGLGGKVFGGVTIAPRTTLELGYHFLPHSDGDASNAVTLGVGLRF